MNYNKVSFCCLFLVINDCYLKITWKKWYVMFQFRVFWIWHMQNFEEVTKRLVCLTFIKFCNRTEIFCFQFQKSYCIDYFDYFHTFKMWSRKKRIQCERKPNNFCVMFIIFSIEFIILSLSFRKVTLNELLAFQLSIFSSLLLSLCHRNW